MEFAKRVWRLLVGIKDGLTLAFLLVFFMGLSALLSARGGAPGYVRDGALLIRLNGTLVEEKAAGGGVSALLTGSPVASETRERDVVLALRAAAVDGHIKAVALDLSNFAGGGLVHLEEIGAAMDAVRAAKKPVLLYGFVLQDGGTLLAAHASDAWIDPLGGAFLPGPGGERLYYGALLQRLKINVHIFRVGTYKDYVEPYFLNKASPASKSAETQLIAAIWRELKANIAHARPKAKIDLVTGDPVGWFKASGGDGGRAALAAGLADHIGTWAQFGAHVAKIAGADALDTRAGAFAHTGMAALIAAHPASTSGKAVGVVTVAGDIVGGKAGPGTAGGERIAGLIDEALAGGDLAALVVRVDSPGGTVVGGEAIRNAVLRARAKGLPVVVSMANVAASGGYLVATPATRIFAQPGTITGSIGIFGAVPSFENVLGQYGVTSDGVRTTPLSGQPDVFAGFTPEMSAIIQAEIDHGYQRFIGMVAAARHKTLPQVDALAQGRVWDGVTARNIGLVDSFGGLDEAEAAAAAAARLKAGEWHEQPLASAPPGGLAGWLAGAGGDDDDNAGAWDASAPRDWVAVISQRQRGAFAAALDDAGRLMGGGGVEAYCLVCASAMPRAAPAPAAGAPSGMPGWLVSLFAPYTSVH